ncbi:MAG TPA: acetate/propionate family kinase [Pseudomonadales bacterium]|nr:acetate/propionate family kinase [Pseudomonadales bacterium]
MSILALNGGSSTIKAALFRCENNQLVRERSWSMERPRTGNSLAFLQSDLSQAPVTIVHRVVHGGDKFSGTIALDDSSIDALRALVPLAPLHQPFNLELIDAAREQWPDARNIACLDTAFHQTQTDLQRRYALPRALHERGIKHYGFHGLSYAYVSRTLYTHAPELHDKRVVIAHLGSGASMCAVRHGKSICTSMGFSPLDGLVMGTRCGQLDPGVILHLLREGMNTQELEKLLYKQSGLLGVSGTSADLRELLASNDTYAQEAVQLFVNRCCEIIASLAASMQGIDALVFTGGIGEHQSETRARIVERLDWLGARLDTPANLVHATRFHAADSALQLFVIPTDEELEMVTQALLLN